jgi:hypothetical protein
LNFELSAEDPPLTPAKKRDRLTPSKNPPLAPAKKRDRLLHEGNGFELLMLFSERIVPPPWEGARGEDLLKVGGKDGRD